MKTATIQECLEHFASIEVNAYEDGGGVYVETSTRDVYVEISANEIQFRAQENSNQ